MRSTSRRLSDGPFSRRAARSLPSTNSKARKSIPWSSPASNRVTTFGWRRRPAARASRSRRFLRASTSPGRPARRAGWVGLRARGAPGGPGFAPQALFAVLDVSGPADQADGLDGEPAFDLGVFGEVHLPHGAGAQEVEDAVAADGAAALQGVQGGSALEDGAGGGFAPARLRR